MPSEYGEVFPEPVAPAEPISYAYIHTHDLTLVGAQLNSNKTWSSLWQCSLCPDLIIGGYIGRVPEGFCHACGWVQQKKWPRKKCEECKTPLVWGREKLKKPADDLLVHKVESIEDTKPICDTDSNGYHVSSLWHLVTCPECLKLLSEEVGRGG